MGVSVKVGGAGGRGAMVIPEGPVKSPETTSCAPVNRHGREGEGRQANVHVIYVTCGEDLWPQHISYIRQAHCSENSHVRKSHVQMRI